METSDRFAVVFEKLAEAVQEEATPKGASTVSIEFIPQEMEEIRRLSEAIAEVTQAHYQVVTTA
jgi:hypothetical protein